MTELAGVPPHSAWSRACARNSHSQCWRTRPAPGTFGGYYVRAFLTKRTGLPDLVCAVAEDALAIGLGTFAVNRFLRS